MNAPEKINGHSEWSGVLTFLSSFRTEVLDKLVSLENRLSNLGDRHRQLEDRISGCKCCARHCDPEEYTDVEHGGHYQQPAAQRLDPKNSGPELGKDGSPFFVENGTVLLTSLNSFSNFPNGSWLGDESEPKRRVRVPLDPKTILGVNSTFRTPEKMALKLLDLLFDRDTQANSNLSGSSKYGKQRLNPVFVYGILCHLVHMFKISQNDWDKIKLSIDSKCRSAFRRKRKAQDSENSTLHKEAKSDNQSLKATDTPRNASQDIGKNARCGDLSIDSPDDVNALMRPSFEFDDMPASHSTPGGSERVQRTDLPLNTDVSDDILPVSEGFLEVVYVTPEHMMTLHQTHKIQVQSDGSILAMPIEPDPKEPDKN